MIQPELGVRGAQGWWGKRGSQRGAQVRRPAQAGAAESSHEPDSSHSPQVFPLQQYLEMLCFSQTPRLGKAAPSPPKHCLLSETAKPEPISSVCPPSMGDPQFRPEADPSRSLPAGRNQSRTPGLEHKCNRFYFSSFVCLLLEAGSESGPALAVVLS